MIQPKSVLNGFDNDELYDLETDPYEMINLAPDPSYDFVLREMTTRMWQRIHETDDFNMYNSPYWMFHHIPVGPSPIVRAVGHVRQTNAPEIPIPVNNYTKT